MRLPHLLDWLAAARPDVACLQETKTEDPSFPLKEIQAAGYQAVFCGQKSYNGVAIVAKSALTEVRHGIPDFADDPKRVIAATVNGVRVLCLYAPNGEAPGTDKYAYKLRWYDALTRWLKVEVQKPLAVLGDLNIAPEPRDVGVTHFCLVVDDLAGLYERLRAGGGCAFLSEPIEVDTGANRGGSALYLRDPDGIIVELFQPPPRD